MTKNKFRILGLVAIIAVVSSIALAQADVLSVAKLGSAEKAPPLRWKLFATDPYDIATVDSMTFQFVDPDLNTVTGSVNIIHWSARSDGIYIILSYGSLPDVPDGSSGSTVTVSGTYTDGTPFEISGAGFLWRRWGG
jgi:hypothetical protein